MANVMCTLTNLKLLPPGSQVALHVTDHGRNRLGVQKLVNLLWDALLHMPASSVNVEKLHANTQETATAHRAGRTEKSLQLHTYVMSARLEHKRLKQSAEDETLGLSKHRAGRLLSSRVVARSLPGNSSAAKPRSSSSSRRSLMPLGMLILRRHQSSLIII